MAVQIFRINYKSDFILTLKSDAGWMTPFCIKFWTGAPSQAFYVGWDGTTYTHCAYDPSEPTKLLVQFDDHHLPIGDLKFQIAYHFTVADFPNDTEDEVINPSNITTEIDGQTYQVMLDFTGETAPEIEFSLPAYANEAQRIANEQQRIANEQQRIADEQTRIANEETRQRNEATRIAQEEARVSEFARLKRESQQATTDANDAATLANQKAQLAQDKAALAQEAATLANQKAQLAADKAALANDAAQLANEKAALAQQKAEYAQTQGGYAKDQGDYAKDQGDYAKAQGTIAEEDHSRAEADHGIAVDDHTQAGNDHTRAESDHGIASTDHTTAQGDHTQAGDDHTIASADHANATSDHTLAGNDHTRAESDHSTAAEDHTNAAADHTQAGEDHAQYLLDHESIASKANVAPNPTEGNVAALDSGGNPIDSGIPFEKVAKTDGSYKTMAVGIADNLAGRSIVTGSFFERPTGGVADVANGLGQIQEVQGGSVKFNQMFDVEDKETTTEEWGTYKTENGKITVNFTTGYDMRINFLERNIRFIAGHKYLINGSVGGTTAATGTHRLWIVSNAAFPVNNRLYSYDGGLIATAAANENIATNNVFVQFMADEVSGTYIFTPQLYDLTDIFGAGNEPTTVEAFEAWLSDKVGLRKIYGYIDSSVINNCMTGIESIGFNLLDPATSKAEIIGVYSEAYDAYYGITGTYGTLTFEDRLGNTSTITPGSDGKFLLEVAGTLTVTNPSDDCAVFLWWDGTKTEYEDYTHNVANLDVKHIYGKKNGEGSLVQVWPTGMPKVSDIVDKLCIEDGAVVAKRNLGEVDLGNKTYTYNDTYQGFISGQSYAKNRFKAICSKYPFVGSFSALVDKSCGYIYNTNIIIRDSDFSSEQINDFKTAMSGVMLYFELDTPETYTDLVYQGSSIFPDGTPVTLPVNYQENNWGVERILPVNTSEIKTAKPTIICKYSIDAVEQLDSHSTEIAELQTRVQVINTEMANVDGVYDISAAHSNATYTDLSAALGTNGANVPASVRKGGMSVKYIQSSDNKYVQYRLMATAFSAAVTNWQGVDEEPTAGSNNLVKSGGVQNALALGAVNINNVEQKVKLYFSPIWRDNRRLYFFSDSSKLEIKGNKTVASSDTVLCIIIYKGVSHIIRDTVSSVTLTLGNLYAGLFIPQSSVAAYYTLNDLVVFTDNNDHDGYIRIATFLYGKMIVQSDIIINYADYGYLLNEVENDIRTVSLKIDVLIPNYNYEQNLIPNASIGADGIMTQLAGRYVLFFKMPEVGVAPIITTNKTINAYQWYSSSPDYLTGSNSLGRTTTNTPPSTAAYAGLTFGAGKPDYIYIQSNADVTEKIGFYGSALNNSIGENCFANGLRTNLKILAYGNSFMRNSIAYLSEIAKNGCNVNLTVGNLYTGGTELQDHYSALVNNTNPYEWHKYVDGVNTVNQSSQTAMRGLLDERWDAIILHQYIPWEYPFEPTLNLLIKLIIERIGYTPKIYINATWAGSLDNNETYYGYETEEEMWQAMLDYVKQACKDSDIQEYSIIPTGTAIQNARTLSFADSYNRFVNSGTDWHHLNPAGGFIAACTVYEKIVAKLNGVHCSSTTFRITTPTAMPPSNQVEQGILVTDDNYLAMCNAAIKAVESPYVITDLNT